MRIKRILALMLCLCSIPVFAQDWGNKKSAVVLTYDDALNVHLDHALPALDSLQLKGTFFLTTSMPAFTTRLKEWQKAAEKGHELGNHTLFHPCNGSLPGRGFVSPDYDLATYSLRRIMDEINMTNTVLQALDGKQERTFAYPCGDLFAGDSSYVLPLKKAVVAARGVQNEMVQRANADLYNIGSYVVMGQTGDDLIAVLKKAMQTNSLVVFLFHGVGGEHALDVSLEAHRQLLHFIKEHEKELWNPTFIEAANYIKARPQKRNRRP